MRTARQEPLVLRGMGSPIHADFMVAGYEVQGWSGKLSLGARSALNLLLSFVSHGTRFLAGIWGSTLWVLDPLFEASADLGEIFVGLLGFDLCNLLSFHRPSKS